MNEIMENCAKKNAFVIVDIVKKNGGYISYDDLRALANTMFLYSTFEGFGSAHALHNNNIVHAAHTACDMGLLINDYKTGYSLAKNDAESPEDVRGEV